MVLFEIKGVKIMEEMILKVLDKQSDGFICPNQSEFFNCDSHN